MGKQPLVSAHAGRSRQYPENTVLAFRKAIELGVDMIELDVRVSKDKQVVVRHDDDLPRRSGKAGKISQLAYNQVREHDVGEGETVPLLRDALQLVKGTPVKLNIEIKVFEAEQLILELVRSTGTQDAVMYSSFLFPVLFELRDLDPGAILCPLIGNAGTMNARSFLKQAGTINPAYFNIGHESITGSLVKQLHEHGIGVQAWTPDTLDDFKRLIDMDIDVIITNKPELLLSHLGRT